MTTPDHIARIIERIEPADREALEQYLAETAQRIVTLQGVIKILEQDNKALVAASQHPDDIAVDAFAGAMKDKLAASRDKGRSGWDDPEQCSVEYLATLLVQHVAKGDPIDVANLAMMLHQRGAGGHVLASCMAEAQIAAVKKFADKVWKQIMRHYRTIKVFPLTMAKEYAERIRKEAS